MAYKKIFTCLVFTSILTFGYTQNLNPKLTQVYTDDYLKNLSSTQPQLIDYLSYYADFGYYIEETQKPLNEFQSINEIPLINLKGGKTMTRDFGFNSATFNILNYQLEIEENRQYINLGNQQLLVILSRKEFLEKFNQRNK